MTKMSFCHKWRIPVILFFSGIILSVISLEALTRIFLPAPLLMHFGINRSNTAFQPSANPILGYELKPNYRSDSKDCHNSFPYINSFGLRDIERNLVKDPKYKRVILLGDSVVAGHGLCSMGDTISQKTELLAKSLNFDYEVLNFGIGGYCSRAEVELLKTKGIQFRPDIVALIFVANDYVDSNSNLVSALNQEHYLAADFLFANSHVFRRLVLGSNFLGLGPTYDPDSGFRLNRKAVGSDNVGQALPEFLSLSKQHSFLPIIFLWPYFDDRGIQGPLPEFGGGPPNATRVDVLAGKLGIKVFDLKPAFLADFQKLREVGKRRKPPSPRWTYTIGDGTHPSKYGSEVASREIFRTLQELVVSREYNGRDGTIN